MKLRELSLEDALQVREWRNARLDALRTPYPLTEQEQAKWYANREGRWWAIVDGPVLLRGYGGIQHIQWENRIGELSLLMGPDHVEQRGEALDLILTEAFDYIGLVTVYAEVYDCNRNAKWWPSAAFARRCIDAPKLPNRKYYRGRYWDSRYFSFDRDAYCPVKE